MSLRIYQRLLSASVLVSLAAVPVYSMTLEEARAAAAKGNTTAMLELAAKAIDAYHFDEAVRAIDKYRAKVGSDKPLNAEAAALLRRAELGVSMLDRVEQVQVIDSLIVDADAFFEAFNLSPQAGTLVDGQVVNELLPTQWLQEHVDALAASPVYVTESGERMLWSTDGGDRPTSNTMWEMDRLADGTWDQPRAIFDYTSVFGGEDKSGETVYSPYLMSDGVTLYFSAEGDASLGGLDIFNSRRDDDDTYLQATNIGMPYNSPADDYMLAIDELTGIGWWATDRNNIPGKVTIYRFVPSEFRRNYAPDTPGLAALASLQSGVAATHPADADYSALLSGLPAGKGNSKSAEADFVFALPGGVIYTSFDDFKSDNARRLMENYIERYDEADLDRTDLERLRLRYRNGDHSVRREILELERRQEENRARLRSMANEVIRAEVGTAAR